MSQSMGHLGDPFHPEVTQALENAVRKIVAAGRTAGAGGIPENVSRRIGVVGRLFSHGPPSGGVGGAEEVHILGVECGVCSAHTRGSVCG